MSDIETFFEMFIRFTDNVNSLKALGRDIPNVESVTRF